MKWLLLALQAGVMVSLWRARLWRQFPWFTAYFAVTLPLTALYSPLASWWRVLFMASDPALILLRTFVSLEALRWLFWGSRYRRTPIGFMAALACGPVASFFGWLLLEEHVTLWSTVRDYRAAEWIRVALTLTLAGIFVRPRCGAVAVRHFWLWTANAWTQAIPAVLGRAGVLDHARWRIVEIAGYIAAAAVFVYWIRLFVKAGPSQGREWSADRTASSRSPARLAARLLSLAFLVRS